MIVFNWNFPSRVHISKTFCAWWQRSPGGILLVPQGHVDNLGLAFKHLHARIFCTILRLSDSSLRYYPKEKLPAPGKGQLPPSLCAGYSSSLSLPETAAQQILSSTMCPSQPQMLLGIKFHLVVQ